MADKNRTQHMKPHGRAKARMEGKKALAFTLSVLLAWMLAMPTATSATTDDGTGVTEVATATTQDENSASSEATGIDSASEKKAADTADKGSSAAAASDSASKTSTDSKTDSSETAQDSATTSENVSGGVPPKQNLTMLLHLRNPQL